MPHEVFTVGNGHDWHDEIADQITEVYKTLDMLDGTIVDSFEHSDGLRFVINCDEGTASNTVTKEYETHVVGQNHCSGVGFDAELKNIYDNAEQQKGAVKARHELRGVLYLVVEHPA